MDEFAEVAEPYGTFFENLTDLMPSFILALVILALFTYGGWKFSHWITHGFRGGKSSIQRVFYRRVIFGIVFFFGLIMVLPVFGYTQIATFFLAGGSLMAVIFGIAFREIGQNILGGFLLAINRPFEIGDLVAVGEFEGTVITLNLRSTHLRSYEG
jgi:small-conductance mechanosensitive channel